MQLISNAMRSLCMTCAVIFRNFGTVTVTITVTMQPSCRDSCSLSESLKQHYLKVICFVWAHSNFLLHRSWQKHPELLETDFQTQINLRNMLLAFLHLIAQIVNFNLKSPGFSEGGKVLLSENYTKYMVISWTATTCICNVIKSTMASILLKTYLSKWADINRSRLAKCLIWHVLWSKILLKGREINRNLNWTI